MNLNDYCVACYNNARDKGFYATKAAIVGSMTMDAAVVRLEPSVRESRLAEFQTLWGLSRLMLISTELAEAAEAIRKPNLMSDHIEGMPLLHEELADVFIRLADLCGSLGVDLEAAVQAKMAYNASRPHMHGKLA